MISMTGIRLNASELTQISISLFHFSRKITYQMQNFYFCLKDMSIYLAHLIKTQMTCLGTLISL